MATVKKSIAIAAPAAKVFEYVTSPENFPAVWPSMVSASQVKREASGAYSFDWVYKMVGMKFSGHTDTIECETNRRIVTRSQMGITTMFTWSVSESGGVTTLEVTAEYKIPVPVFGGLAERAVARVNDREGDILLENIKRALEA